MASTIIDRTDAILTEGGSTWREDDSSVPTTGYLVSLKDYEVIISSSDLNPGELATYVNTTREIVANDSRLWYGAWHNTENDHVYLDVTAHVSTLAEAELIADLEDQIAIYEINTGEVLAAR